MRKNSIWISKKQMRNRVLFFVVSVVIILILLALIFNRLSPGAETSEEAPASEEEQNLGMEAEQEVDGNADEALEEPPEPECTMMRKHAEDELLDAYKIEKEAKEIVRRLEEDLLKANEKIDEAEVFVKQAQKMLEDAKLCSE
ncbi:MAG: hypothetical protein KAT43_04875 [Nanoarchaeota archaeon]|nr:hypothetical protein [Nanoarchaeota archaeon]